MIRIEVAQPEQTPLFCVQLMVEILSEMLTQLQISKTVLMVLAFMSLFNILTSPLLMAQSNNANDTIISITSTAEILAIVEKISASDLNGFDIIPIP